MPARFPGIEVNNQDPVQLSCLSATRAEYEVLSENFSCLLLLQQGTMMQLLQNVGQKLLENFLSVQHLLEGWEYPLVELCKLNKLQPALSFARQTKLFFT